MKRELAFEGKPYVLVTLHRPSNVDDPSHLGEILRALAELAEDAHVIFPVHPRTRHVMDGIDNLNLPPHLHLTGPLGYLEFLNLQRTAALVITDSGGIQVETTYLGVPCLTVRENTEWPMTVDVGSNILVGRDLELLKREARRALQGNGKKGAIPVLWDGHASERIADILLHWKQ